MFPKLNYKILCARCEINYNNVCPFTGIGIAAKTDPNKWTSNHKAQNFFENM